MAHSLTTTPAAAIPISSSSKSKNPTIHVASLGFQGLLAHHKDSKPASHSNLVHRSRRTVTLGLASGLLLGLTVGEGSANAARRQAPPPPEEKKDPNVSGVQAKVLASKKRKEAMKESIAKLREKGKVVDEQSKPIMNELSE
ncbi:uncharacterized protein LOC8286364 [Ricinus communis]|uniref:Uncharacterized protein n=1 Tax=Ricinus communis TaxID=3988 RepID=B9SFT9_RICCO|nr:uncharacterized protein LOC8286364 [Ricinus communis]EEF37482.1 conserved hypothetical protein [Ricinus communis]|eukprot:XP_002524858.1 uncharacterized protein LOC8286364 [Ricinus communis]